MAEWIPIWVLIPAGILFIGIYSAGLHLLLKKILKKIPIGVPPFLAIVTAVIYTMVAPHGPAPESFVIPMLLLMLTFVIMAVLGAFSFFEGKDVGMRPWMAVGLVSYVAAFLLGMFLLGGSDAVKVGSALPPFSFRFPVLGFILDRLIGLLNLSSVAYFSLGYSIILGVGLYLEVFLWSAGIFFVMSYATEKKVPEC
jgi:hypothetical protein